MQGDLHLCCLHMASAPSDLRLCCSQMAKTDFLMMWLISSCPYIQSRATENRFFAGPDRFLVCKTDSVCIKRIFFGPKKHTLRIIYWPNYLD